MTTRNKKVGGLLLAGGASSRLGRPKQLLQFRGTTLVRRAAQTLVGSACEPIIVVVGSSSLESKREVADLPVTVCVNERWQDGMSTSLTSGLTKLIEIEPEIDAVLIMLCDQPRISSDMIDRIISKYKNSGSGIVASEYNGVRGVPALFAREMFDELFRLEGDNGARHLIRSSRDVEAIDLPEAAFDIDSITDADELNER